MSRCALLLTALLLGTGAPWVRAQEVTPVKLVMDHALSPDGATLAFSWRGDVWLVSTEGGAARRLTFHPADDTRPRFSRDGKKIAFVSDRDARNQVYVMPLEGGAPRRVTRHTDGFTLFEWTPDGSGLLVGARRDHFWRHSGRFFIHPIEGTAAPKMLFNGYGDTATLSPDGNRLLFTREGSSRFRKGYHGSRESQVWVYELETGSFELLHGQGEGGCRWPLWAPDGSHYYASQAQGAWNIRHVDGNGTETLTHYKEDGVLHPSISRDGSTIVFSRLFDVYRLDTASGQVSRIDIVHAGDPTVDPVRRETVERATDVGFSDDAREIAIVAGHDVWVMDTELREPVRVTNTPEEESDPVFSKDYKRLYFISGSGGRRDVWVATRSDPEAYWWQNEEFELRKVTDDELVEFDLRLHPGGDRLAFVRTRGDIVSINPDGTGEEVLVESWDRPSWEFSPDGKWLVYAVDDNDFNTDVWIKPLDGHREPFNLSVHPDDDRDPVWSPDGKRIAFVGRRWGNESDIVFVNLRKKEEETTSRQRKLEKALKKMKGRKKKKGGKKKPATKPAAGEEAAPPDPLSGTWDGVATGVPDMPDGLPFTLEIKLGKDGTVTGTWSSMLGEGEITQARFDKATGTFTFTLELADGPLAGTGKVENGTMTGTWEMMGMEGGWRARRESRPGETAADDEEKKKDKGEKDEVEVVIDFEGIHDRMHRVRVSDSTERGLSWSPDGKRLYFWTSYRGKRGVHYVEFPDELSPKYWTSKRLSDSRWLEDGNRLVGLSGGKPTEMARNGKSKSYEFEVYTETKLPERNQVVFDQAWRTMRDRWYDENLGNNDWEAIRRKYRRAAATVDSGALNIVCNMMLGELNGSHLGFSMFDRNRRRRAQEWREATGHLGTRFDPDHEGPGLRVLNVVKGSPAFREDSRILPGEVILTIDGQEVAPDRDIALALTGKPDREVQVEVRDEEGETRTVNIRPTSYRRIRQLLYDEWVEDNRKKVEELSDGELGYLHIRAMGGGNLIKFDEELFRVGHGRNGLVIDVRENGGGSITDHLLTCLTQPTHAITRPRGGGRGYPQGRRVYATWNKPIVVLCNQNSFSNAEIFSHAIKTLERGQLVGVPTAGGVISTGGTMLMGVARLRLPFRGWYTLDGQDMELHGAVPHHVIWPRPCEWPSGEDRQLEKAVEVLAADVQTWKERPRVKLTKATERGT